jgi:hypothetical protein
MEEQEKKRAGEAGAEESGAADGAADIDARVSTDTPADAGEDGSPDQSAARAASHADSQPSSSSSDMEQFLARMLQQSSEVSGEAIRIVGNRVCVGEEIEQAEEQARRASRERALTPDEARLVSERQAVQRAIDDVRSQSASGKMVTPARWSELGFAPEHLDDDAFAAFALDSISAAQQGEPFEGSGIPALATDSPANDEENGGEEKSEPQSKAAEDGSPKQTDGENPDADTPQPSALPTGDVPSDDTGDAQASEGRETPETTDNGAGTEATDNASASEELEPEVLSTVHDPLDCSDIRIVEDESGIYLYSDRRMSDNYAKWSIQASRGDDLATLVENVRDECRTYPRPMLAKSLCNRPFNMSYQHVIDTFKAVQESGKYPDIRQCEASNGDVYYYSTTFMHTRQAKALAEFYSVERFMSV